MGWIPMYLYRDVSLSVCFYKYNEIFHSSGRRVAIPERKLFFAGNADAPTGVGYGSVKKLSPYLGKSANLHYIAQTRYDNDANVLEGDGQVRFPIQRAFTRGAGADFA
jgi:hypothetical protein